MKDGLLLVVLCVMAIAGIGWFLLPGPAHALFTKTVVSVSPHDPPKPEKPPKAVAKKGRWSAASHGAAAPALEFAPPIAAALTLLPPAAPAPSFGFPAAGDIQVGTDRSRILARYGTPSLAASTADGGHFIETYVYKHNREEALIRLKDGLVSGTHVH